MAVISSPLANSLKGGLVQRVSGSSFGGGGGIGPISSPPSVGGGRSEELLESSSETLTTISSSLASISTEIGTIREGINSIANKISTESRLEASAARAEEEYQRRLGERKVRAAGETELENKIQAALTAPVQRVATKVSNVFQNVLSALGQLFLGWLTNQGIEAIKAAVDRNTDKLKDIGKEVVKGFGFLIGIRGAFTLIKNGIFRVIEAVTGLAARITKAAISGLFINPFRAAINALTGGGAAPSGPGRTPAPSGPDGKPKGKFGLMNLIGKTITGLSGAMNFLNGENIDAALAALSFIPGKGWVFKGLRTVAGTLFTLDEIAEAFGGNLTGAKKKELEEQKKKAEEAQKNGNKPSAETKPTSQPQSTLMGDKKGDDKKPEEGQVNVKPALPLADMSGSGASVPPGMEGSASTSTPSVQPTSTKAPDATSLSLGGSSFGVDTTGLKGPENALSTVKTESTATPADVKPAPTQTADVKAGSIGPEPKRPPTVIATTPPAQPKQQSAPAKSAGTNTPSIKSSNPDNFYALYSQFNYNVVM